MSIDLLLHRLRPFYKNSLIAFRKLFTIHKSRMGSAALIFGVTMFGMGPTPNAANTPDAGQAINVEKVKSYIVEQIPQLEWSPKTVQRWRPYIEKEAKKRNIDPRIPEIIITLESGGDPHAESWVGARGLMQIMPSTGADIARRLGVSNYDLYDPETNIKFGTFYIAERMNRFGDYTDDMSELVRMAAIGYNGGDGRVFNYIKGLSIPNESRIYSNYAHRMWKEREKPRGLAYEEWYNDGHGFVLVEAAKKYKGLVPGQS